MEDLKGRLKPLGEGSPGESSRMSTWVAVPFLSRAGVVRKRTSASPASVYNSGRRRGGKPDVHRTVKRDVPWTEKFFLTLHGSQNRQVSCLQDIHTNMQTFFWPAGTPPGFRKLSSSIPLAMTAVFGPLAAFEPDNPALFTILVRID